MTGDYIHKLIYDECIKQGVEESRARAFAGDGRSKFMKGDFKKATKLVEQQIKAAKGKGKK